MHDCYKSAYDIREEWLRLMGMDDDEIFDHIDSCPPISKDEELEQLNCMKQILLLNKENHVNSYRLD